MPLQGWAGASTTKWNPRGSLTASSFNEVDDLQGLLASFATERGQHQEREKRKEGIQHHLQELWPGYCRMSFVAHVYLELYREGDSGKHGVCELS